MLNEGLSTAVAWRVGVVFCYASNCAILCSVILNILEIWVCMVGIVDFESDCIDCEFFSEGIGAMIGILSGIEVVVDMFVRISFEALIISAVISSVFPCLLNNVYILSSNSSCGVIISMTYALIVFYKTDFLNKKDVSSDTFTSE